MPLWCGTQGMLVQPSWNPSCNHVLLPRASLPKDHTHTQHHGSTIAFFYPHPSLETLSCGLFLSSAAFPNADFGDPKTCAVRTPVCNPNEGGAWNLQVPFCLAISRLGSHLDFSGPHHGYKSFLGNQLNYLEGAGPAGQNTLDSSMPVSDATFLMNSPEQSWALGLPLSIPHSATISDTSRVKYCLSKKKIPTYSGF